MKYDFIEIGTSDFRTIVQSTKDDKIGLCVEPLKFYLDKLPNKKNVSKVNSAISNYNGEIEIYYVSPDDIIKYKLPDWVRGCNSVGKPHTAVVDLLGDKYEEVINKDMVKVITWDVLIEKYDIESIKILKIDTEGHDGVILDEFYNYIIKTKNYELLPKEITFENNYLADKLLIKKVISNFNKLGYSGKQVSYDYVLKKK